MSTKFRTAVSERLELAKAAQRTDFRTAVSECKPISAQISALMNAVIELQQEVQKLKALLQITEKK